MARMGPCTSPTQVKEAERTLRIRQECVDYSRVEGKQQAAVCALNHGAVDGKAAERRTDRTRGK